jgi:hypothetical protein
MRRKKLIPLF